jgi:hypothetical protein
VLEVAKARVTFDEDSVVMAVLRFDDLDHEGCEDLVRKILTSSNPKIRSSYFWIAGFTYPTVSVWPDGRKLR